MQRLVAFLALLALPLRAQSPREEVLATLDAFLAAMRVKDSAGMVVHTDSLTRFTLLRSGANGTRVFLLSGNEFIKLVTRPNQPAFDEVVRNPVVQTDGDVASVWAEYQVRRDGKVTHCGFDAFHLAKLGGRWRILNVSDTYRETGCGERWPTRDGPPMPRGVAARDPQ